MPAHDPIELTRDVEAALIPAGDKVTLQKGQRAFVTQSLGGSHTVVVNGNMFRVEGKDADALGMEVLEKTERSTTGKSRTQGELEQEVWKQLKTCFDPEIPVNVVDLGLIYDCKVEPLDKDNFYRVDVKMTLTAPGCGMGPMLAQDVQNKLLSIEEVGEANVALVWEPQWNQSMMSEEARLQLGLY